MYTFEKREKQGVLNISISTQDWEKEVNAVYELTKGKFNIQGFRKGKAPRKVIEQTYGDTVFFDDAFDRIVSREYGEFLEKNPQITPAGHPHVENNKFTADKGLEVVLVFDLMPEFVLPNLADIKVEKEDVQVTDEQIAEEISHMQEGHARYVEEDKNAENGDFATIDFTGFVDDVKFDGGEAKDYRLELGSHTFIQGFEEQVVGMKVGEEKDINVTFPENYPAENLKGKPAVFKIALKKVEKKVLPEINDKFIADTTEFETLEEYKNSVKENLVKIAQEKADRDYEVKLLDEIADKSNIELAESMIDHEVHHMVEDFEHRLSHQGMKLADYLAYLGKTEEEFKQERRVDAEKNIKTRLVLQRIISENKITVTAEELDNLIGEYATKYGMNVEDFKKGLGENDYAYFENNAIMTKVLNFIKSQTK